MIRAEYIRFLKTLNTAETTIEVKQIANLVLQNLNALIPLSTAQGQRVKKMVALAQENGENLTDTIESFESTSQTTSAKITRLTNLSVESFRGFSKPEDFDLDSQFVLIYGQNGTGKSSFCEALEYGLLGNVTEADNKRLKIKEYLKNAYTDKFTVPVIEGKDKQGTDITITADEEFYRFCFVEKNRINDFSRIAAKAPAKQSELISTLFGLEAFTDFVHNFSSTIDGKYIDLDGKNKKELEEKKQAVAGYQQLLTRINEELQGIENDKNELANKYRNGCKFEAMVNELIGTDRNGGVIGEMEQELQKQVPQKSNLSTTVLQELKKSIESDILELTTNQAKLVESSQEVSFKQLYEAVSQFKESKLDYCPACHTPLNRTTKNPFDNADFELDKLIDLSKLQETIKSQKQKIINSLQELSEIIKICCTRFAADNPLSSFQNKDNQSCTIAWWESIQHKTEEYKTAWQYIAEQVGELEKADIDIEHTNEKYDDNQKKLSRLKGFHKNIIELQTRNKIAKGSKKEAEDAIVKFDIDNEYLIKSVEEEILVLQRNKSIAEAYSRFVQEINKYTNTLPYKLVADLGELVVKLYNAFNRNDDESEQLSKVKLPLEQNQRLEIAFKKDSEKYFDALHVLSEGHIRCVGLAILTAKSIKENCPILIFDDPVNAIDDEHRESIRKTFFEDDFFTGKQIILTCHGEEFFKDIQNLLSVKNVKQAKLFSFLPKNGDSHLRIDFNCPPRNYIIKARSHINHCEVRDALSKSRQALESITKGKLWRYVGQFGDGNLSIKLRSAKAPIELRNLTEQLKSKIANNHFLDENKYAILNSLTTILGIDGNSREWRYLNKGTHDELDSAEFERATVNEIITALEEIYNVLTSK